MVAPPLCNLCGKTIDFNRNLVPLWKTICQSLRIQPGIGHLESPRVYGGNADLPAIHSSCWKVVEKVVGNSQIGDEWLKSFENLLHDFGPFLPRTCYDAAPDILENDLEYDLDDGLEQNDVNSGDCPLYLDSLPPEIIQIIYSFLPFYTDIISLRHVIHYPPNPKTWLHIGRRFIPFNDRFPVDNTADTVLRIECALKNTYTYPSRFPHAANYERVWENIELILHKMKTSLYSKNSTLAMPARKISPFDPHARASRTPAIRMLKEVNIRCWKIVDVHFSCVQNQRHVCGFAFDGTLIGY